MEDTMCNIFKFENWSLNDTINKIFPIFLYKTDYSMIAYSDKEINEMEMYGLEHVIKNWINLCDKWDITTTIVKGCYNYKTDTIRPLLDCHKMPKITNIVEKYELYRNKEDFKKALREAETIIYIQTTFNRRKNRDWSHKKMNPIKHELINTIEYF